MAPAELFKYGMILLSGLLLKMAWDWLQEGHAATGITMKTTDCEKHRATCDPAAFKQDFATHKATVEQKINNFEKRLDQGSKDFKTIADDISKIKTDLAVLTAIFKNHFEGEKDD